MAVDVESCRAARRQVTGRSASCETERGTRRRTDGLPQ